MYYRSIVTILLMGFLCSCQGSEKSRNIALRQHYELAKAPLLLGIQGAFDYIEETVEDRPHLKPMFNAAKQIRKTARSLDAELKLLREDVEKGEEGQLHRLDRLLFFGQEELIAVLDHLIEEVKEKEIDGVKFDLEAVEEIKNELQLSAFTQEDFRKKLQLQNLEKDELQLVFQQFEHQLWMAATKLICFVSSHTSVKCNWHYHVFDVFSSSAKPVVLEGEDYSCNIAIGAYSSRLEFSVNVDGQALHIADGKAAYKSLPQRLGTHQYTTRIAYENPITHKVDSLIRTFEYEVVLPQVAVSLDKVRVLSRCFYNRLKLVSSAHESDELELKGPVGLEIRKLGKHEYEIRVTGPIPAGKYCELRVIERKSKRVLQKFNYKIITCPTPTAKLVNGKTDAVVKAAEMRVMNGLMATIDNHDIDARCNISSFQLYYLREKGDPIVLKNVGGRFGPEIIDAIQNVKAGETLQFTDVMGHCPGDLSSRRLNSLAFMIR